MTSADLTKLFWVLKKVVDDDGHYLGKKERLSLHHALGALLLLKAKREIAEDSRFYRLCPVCKTELDLRLMGLYHFVDGMAVHNRCPSLKNDVLRDI